MSEILQIKKYLDKEGLNKVFELLNTNFASVEDMAGFESISNDDVRRIYYSSCEKK